MPVPVGGWRYLRYDSVHGNMYRLEVVLTDGTHLYVSNQIVCTEKDLTGHWMVTLLSHPILLLYQCTAASCHTCRRGLVQA